MWSTPLLHHVSQHVRHTPTSLGMTIMDSRIGLVHRKVGHMQRDHNPRRVCHLVVKMHDCLPTEPLDFKFQSNSEMHFITLQGSTGSGR